MKKKSLIIIMAVLLVFATGCNKKKENKSNDIVKDAIQTHEYFDDKGYGDKFIIENEGDFDKFTSVFSDDIEEYRDKLNGNTIFVMLVEKGSGSIQLELKDVNFDGNTVNFVVNTINPSGAGTDDMALWYLVAVVPNEKLEGLDLSDWTNASSLVK